MGIVRFWVSSLSDVDCNHRHLSYEAAEKCARKRIRRGETYIGKPMNVDDAESCVKGKTSDEGIGVR